MVLGLDCAAFGLGAASSFGPWGTRGLRGDAALCVGAGSLWLLHEGGQASIITYL